MRTGRFYADEHFPALAVEELRRLGHDVWTVHEDGLGGRKFPDLGILQRATELERAVLTLNRRDFIRLHGESQNHSGIIVCTQNLDFPQLAHQIGKAVSERTDLAGSLIRVYRPENYR